MIAARDGRSRKPQVKNFNIHCCTLLTLNLIECQTWRRRKSIIVTGPPHSNSGIAHPEGVHDIDIKTSWIFGQDDDLDYSHSYYDHRPHSGNGGSPELSSLGQTTRDEIRCCAAEMAPHRNSLLPSERQHPKAAGANSNWMKFVSKDIRPNRIRTEAPDVAVKTNEAECGDAFTR